MAAGAAGALADVADVLPVVVAAASLKVLGAAPAQLDVVGCIGHAASSWTSGAAAGNL